MADKYSKNAVNSTDAQNVCARAELTDSSSNKHHYKQQS